MCLNAAQIHFLLIDFSVSYLADAFVHSEVENIAEA